MMRHFADDLDMALTRFHTGRLIALVLFAALVPARATQAAEWSLCTPSTVPPAPAAGLVSTTIEADSATLRHDGVSVAEGNAILMSPERRITAPRMEYESEASRFAAAGAVTVRTREMFLEGERLRVDLASDETVMHRSRFRHPDSHGRGEAERIESVPGTTVITGGSFTTCDPGSNAWRLEAKTLTLDRASRTGTARHARLKIREVPVLYMPWVSFPLGSERKTGLLMPSFATSGSRGTTVTQPLYLNLAPSYDATLRLRLMSRRGGALEGQFRYLTERGDGMVEAEGLPEDRVTGEARSLLSFRHRQRFTPRLRARVEYARASDIDYLRDLGAGIDAANTDYLRRSAELAYDAPAWRLETQVEGFQTLKKSPEQLDPYQLLPRLALTSRSPERVGRFNYGLRGEIAHFKHRSSHVAGGARVDLQPTLSFPFRRPAGYLLPRATLRFTGYDLDNSNRSVSVSASRTVPILSVGGGLFFDREFSFRERRLTHALEPRLYYLRVPYRDQDHLPLFDAGTLTFNHDHLFRENRFSGTDRIGDADRLTLALDNHLLDEGRDVLGVRLAHTRHFRDRRVRLCTTADPMLQDFRCPPGGEGIRPHSPRSVWAAALTARPHRSVTIAGELQHDGSESRSRPIALGLRYQPSSTGAASIDYRRVPVTTGSLKEVAETAREVTESVTLSAHRNLRRHLRIFGSMSHALEKDRVTRSNAGLEYDSCCWRLRILGQRYLRERDEYENSVLLQWELKGWTGSEFRLR